MAGLGGSQGAGGRQDVRAAEELICSARGCRAPARWAVVWNNPKIHTPDREKIWLACEAHREYLGEYLGRRHFLKRIDPLEDTQT